MIQIRKKAAQFERELSESAGRLDKAMEENSSLQMVNKDYEVKYFDIGISFLEINQKTCKN